MRRIKFKHKRNRGVWGLAFPDEFRIELDPELDERLKLEIACHEAMHVLLPAFPEDTINEFGKIQSDLLWRIGFRLKDEEE